MKFSNEDLANLQACVGYASVMVTAQSLPSFGNMVSKIAMVSKEEETFTAEDLTLLQDIITMALQSQKVIPARSFDPNQIATLGRLVEKLQKPEDSCE